MRGTAINSSYPGELAGSWRMSSCLEQLLFSWMHQDTMQQYVTTFEPIVHLDVSEFCILVPQDITKLEPMFLQDVLELI